MGSCLGRINLFKYLLSSLSIINVNRTLSNFKLQKKTNELIKKKQARIIFLTTLISFVLATLTDLIFPELYNFRMPLLGDLIILIWAFGIVYALTKYRLMIFTPSTAADKIVSIMSDSLILLDREGNITNINNATLDLSGYGKNELKGESIALLFKEKYFKNILLDSIIKGEIIKNYELGLNTKRGNNITVLFSSSAMMDEAGGIAGIICLVKDIIERKKIEENIKKAKDELQMMIDSVPAMIYYIDIENRVVRTNKELADLLKMSIKRLIGQKIEDLFSKEQVERMKKDSQEIIFTGKAKKNIIELYDLSKGTKWVITDKIPYKDKEGKVIGIVCLSKDITAQKQSEQKLQQSYQELKKTMDKTISTISKIIEAKDPYTAGHQRRVSQLAVAMAKKLKYSQDKIEGVKIASLIHDIGKIGLPFEILSKPGKLEDEEFKLIERHSQIGYSILKTINFSYPVAQIVLQHHERLNGSGYPNHLRGDEILPEAKILGVADVVEAMSSHRPYRPSLGINLALKEINQNKGILYGPEEVDACLRLFKEKGFKFE